MTYNDINAFMVGTVPGVILTALAGMVIAKIISFLFGRSVARFRSVRQTGEIFSNVVAVATLESDHARDYVYRASAQLRVRCRIALSVTILALMLTLSGIDSDPSSPPWLQLIYGIFGAVASVAWLSLRWLSASFDGGIHRAYEVAASRNVISDFERDFSRRMVLVIVRLAVHESGKSPTRVVREILELRAMSASSESAESGAIAH